VRARATSKQLKEAALRLTSSIVDGEGEVKNIREAYMFTETHPSGHFAVFGNGGSLWTRHDAWEAVKKSLQGLFHSRVCAVSSSFLIGS
jgi:hypothetical protein